MSSGKAAGDGFDGEEILILFERDGSDGSPSELGGLWVGFKGRFRIGLKDIIIS